MPRILPLTKLPRRLPAGRPSVPRRLRRRLRLRYLHIVTGDAVAGGLRLQKVSAILNHLSLHACDLRNLQDFLVLLLDVQEQLSFWLVVMREDVEFSAGLR